MFVQHGVPFFCTAFLLAMTRIPQDPMFDSMYYILGISAVQLLLACIIFFMDVCTRSFCCSLTCKRVLFKTCLFLLCFVLPIVLWVFVGY
jgi:hypothetical protein